MAFVAEGVEVHIDDQSVISALNTPGGAIFDWRDERAREVVTRAITTSPVNDKLNQMHRVGIGAPPGRYKASWHWDRVGSNQHRVQATIVNFAPHAHYVEFGRRSVLAWQRFSWTKWEGQIRTIKHTRDREGQDILKSAANYVGIKSGDWTPLF